MKYIMIFILLGYSFLSYSQPNKNYGYIIINGFGRIELTPDGYSEAVQNLRGLRSVLIESDTLTTIDYRIIPLLENTEELMLNTPKLKKLPKLHRKDMFDYFSYTYNSAITIEDKASYSSRHVIVHVDTLPSEVLDIFSYKTNINFGYANPNTNFKIPICKYIRFWNNSFNLANGNFNIVNFSPYRIELFSCMPEFDKRIKEVLDLELCYVPSSYIQYITTTTKIRKISINKEEAFTKGVDGKLLFENLLDKKIDVEIRNDYHYNDNEDINIFQEIIPH